MEISRYHHTTLVPVDFSKGSEEALTHALQIADMIEDENAAVTVLHVLEDTELELQDAWQMEGGTDPKGLMLEGARYRFEQLRRAMGKHSRQDFNALIVGGYAFRQIVEVARTIDADSIVMGTHGARGWRKFLGTTASRIIQHAHCPVVVLNEFHPQKARYQSIILPLDFTKDTQQKVTWAARVGHYFGSTVHIVAVREDNERLARRIELRVREASEYLEQQGVRTEAHQLVEVKRNFAMATLQFARELHADLIMIMTQQERSLGEYLFGSYAQQIVMQSEIPVMCITPRTELDHAFRKGD
mgnify:CR=1 FL=1